MPLLTLLNNQETGALPGGAPPVIGLGCGATRIFIFARPAAGSTSGGAGGTTAVAELAFGSVEYGRVLDDTSTCEISLPGVASSAGQACCRSLTGVKPWKHEVGVYRDGLFVWGGPIIRMTFGITESKVYARDLSAWLDRRTIHNDHAYTAVDLATIFSDLWTDAMAPDNPNFTLTTVASGLPGDRTVWASAHRAARRELDELARTGIDWTVVGRTMNAGGTGVVTHTIGLLTDEAFATMPDVDVDGMNQVNRELAKGGGSGMAEDPFYGEAPTPKWPNPLTAVGVYPALTAAQIEYGLLERVTAEKRIADQASADQAAATRLALLGTPPATVQGGRLAATAPLRFAQLVPGATVDVRLVTSCWPVLAQFRLQEVKVTATPEAETVDVTFQPLGTLGQDDNS